MRAVVNQKIDGRRGEVLFANEKKASAKRKVAFYAQHHGISDEQISERSDVDRKDSSGTCTDFEQARKRFRDRIRPRFGRDAIRHR